MPLFNAAKTGKFGRKLSEKLWKMSAGKQTAVVLTACLLAAAAGPAIYAALAD